MTRVTFDIPGLEWSDAADVGVFGAIDNIDVEDFSTPGLQYPTKNTTIATIQDVDFDQGSDQDSDQESVQELLVVSPYTSRSHLLDLSSVSRENQLMARSLTSMRPIRSDYATAAYAAAFNWSGVVDYLRCLLLAENQKFQASRFYIVVFRSQVPRSTDRSRLGVLDELAHEEAMESGGLLKYWFGTPDQSGRNLATCVWRHRDDARLGGAGPGHAKAMQETRALYTEWQVERLSLNVSKDAQSWSISKWDD